MNEYEIWSEGYLYTGMEGHPTKASYHGIFKAESFKEACKICFKDDKDYCEKSNNYWGCRLFDNKKDARKMFG